MACMSLSSLRARLPYVAAALLAVVALFVILFLRGSTARARLSQLSVAELGVEANYLSSLEWRAVAEGGIAPEVAEQRSALRARVERHFLPLRLGRR